MRRLILRKPVLSFPFLFVCFSLSRFSNRSAGEHLDVRLLLILPSPSFFFAHPALSPLSTPLFIPPSVTGQMDEEKCQPPEERGGGRERDHPVRPFDLPYHFHLTALFHSLSLGFLVNIFTHSRPVLSLGELKMWPERSLSFHLLLSSSFGLIHQLLL